MCVRGRIGGLGWRGWRAGQAWFGRHPIRREGLSIREPVFVIRHGVGVQAGLVGVGTAHALWRRSGRRVVAGTEVAKDLLGHARVVNHGDNPIGFGQTGQRNGSKCQTRRIRSRHVLDGSWSVVVAKRPAYAEPAQAGRPRWRTPRILLLA